MYILLLVKDKVLLSINYRTNDILNEINFILAEEVLQHYWVNLSSWQCQQLACYLGFQDLFLH